MIAVPYGAVVQRPGRKGPGRLAQDGLHLRRSELRTHGQHERRHARHMRCREACAVVPGIGIASRARIRRCRTRIRDGEYARIKKRIPPRGRDGNGRTPVAIDRSNPVRGDGRNGRHPRAAAGRVECGVRVFVTRRGDNDRAGGLNLGGDVHP